MLKGLMKILGLTMREPRAPEQGKAESQLKSKSAPKKRNGRVSRERRGDKGCFGGPGSVGRKMSRRLKRRAGDYLSFLTGARRKKSA